MKEIVIKKTKLTINNLKLIKRIDDCFYNEKELTLNWYISRYNKNHNAYLLLNNNVCVGYLVCVPIKQELYDLIISGALDNDLNINSDMFIKKSKYKYIVSTVIIEKYRYLGFGNMLMETMLKYEKGNFCALTITKDGYKLAEKYLKFKKQVNDKVSVFVLKNDN